MVHVPPRAALLALALLAVPATAQAGDTVFTWTVDSTVDAVSAGAADGVCAVGGVCTLREAVKEAQAEGAPDTINRIPLPAGRYDLDSALSGFGTGRVEITGPQTGEAVIGGQNAHRVLSVAGGARVTVRRVSVVQGATTGDGGLITVTGADLRVAESVLADGSASDSGGAIAAGAGADVGLSDTVVQDNAAGPGGSGGGILFAGDSLSLERVTLLGNTAGYAGAIHVGPTGGTVHNVSISESTFADNAVTGQAAALRIEEAEVSDSFFLGRSTFVGNSTSLPGTTNAALQILPVDVGDSSLGSLVLQDNAGGSCFGAGAATAAAVQSISDDASCGFVAPSSVNATDPLLGPVSLQGGWVPVALPGPGSPAIDRSTDCVGGSVDARGFERLAGAETQCDAGAAERIVTDVRVGVTAPATAAAGVSGAFTATVTPVSTRSPEDLVVRLSPSPGAEIVDVDTHEPSDVEHLLCTRDGAELVCTVNGDLNTPRSVGVRVRRATPGPLELRVAATSATVEATPSDNETAAGPVVPVPTVPGSGSVPTPTPTPGPPVTPPGAGTPASPSPSVRGITVRRNARTRRHTVAFILEAATKVTLVLERRVVRRGRTRFVKVTTITRALSSGRRSVVLPAKVKGKALPKGTYRVALRAFGPSGRGSATVRKAFRVR